MCQLILFLVALQFSFCGLSQDDSTQLVAPELLQADVSIPSDDCAHGHMCCESHCPCCPYVDFQDYFEIFSSLCEIFTIDLPLVVPLVEGGDSTKVGMQVCPPSLWVFFKNL